MTKKNRQLEKSKFEIALEAISFLDECASKADMKRPEHFAVQNANDYLVNFVREVEQELNPQPEDPDSEIDI